MSFLGTFWKSMGFWDNKRLYRSCGLLFKIDNIRCCKAMYPLVVFTLKKCSKVCISAQSFSRFSRVNSNTCESSTQSIESVAFWEEK